VATARDERTRDDL
jgi:NAD(P)-dependent dehydrogenase (short-subunit alcohol dehydrogenase family)